MRNIAWNFLLIAPLFFINKLGLPGNIVCCSAIAALTLRGYIGVAQAVCILSMVVATFALLYGLRWVSFAPLQRWAHALAGVALMASGGAVTWLGL